MFMSGTQVNGPSASVQPVKPVVGQPPAASAEFLQERIKKALEGADGIFIAYKKGTQERVSERPILEVLAPKLFGSAQEFKEVGGVEAAEANSRGVDRFTVDQPIMQGSVMGMLLTAATTVPAFDRNLVYHNGEHIRDVVRAALKLALAEGGLSKRELYLVAIAATLHDIGYIKGAKGHEDTSAQLAQAAMREINTFNRETLPEEIREDFTEKEMLRVADAIRGTKLEFVPGKLPATGESSCLIANILKDADLAGLALPFDKFIENSLKVFWEMHPQLRGVIKDSQQLLKPPDAAITVTEGSSERIAVAPLVAKFMQGTLNLLKGTRWRTSYAQQHWSAGLHENITKLERALR